MPRPLAPARAIKFRTCAVVFQPCRQPNETCSPQTFSVTAAVVAPAVVICLNSLIMLRGAENLQQTTVFTAVSRKIVEQNRARQCGKVLWVMGVQGPRLRP